MLSESIDLLYKPHNAPVPYPTIHHYITKMCTILFLLQNHAFWVIFLMHCGICEIDQSIHFFYSLTAFANKNTRRNDSHIGCNKGFRLMTFYPEAVIKMPLWYMHSVWNSTIFSLWNYISNVNWSKRPVSDFYVAKKRCLLCLIVCYWH